MIAQNQLIKALVVVFIFTLGFSYFLLYTIEKEHADYGRHFFKASTDCKGDAEKYGWEINDWQGQNTCETYAPLFHWLAKPFAFDMKTFNYFLAILIFIATPLTLVYISRHWISAWFFFATTHYAWYFIDGAYPQALANLLAIAILIEKDWKIDIILALLATISHSHGFILALVVLTAKYFNKLNIKETIIKITGKIKFFGLVLLQCSGIFGNKRPEILETKVEDIIGGHVTNTGSPMELRDPLQFVTRTFPVMYIYWAVKKAWQKNRIDLIIIAVFAIIGGFTTSARMFYVVPLALIPALSWFYKDLNPNQKKWFILLTIANFLFLLWAFVNLKQTCLGFKILPF